MKFKTIHIFKILKNPMKKNKDFEVTSFLIYKYKKALKKKSLPLSKFLKDCQNTL